MSRMYQSCIFTKRGQKLHKLFRTYYSYSTGHHLICSTKLTKDYLHILRRLQRLRALNHKSLNWAFLEFGEYWISKVAYANSSRFQKEEKKMFGGKNNIFLKKQLIFILYFSSIRFKKGIFSKMRFLQASFACR